VYGYTAASLDVWWCLDVSCWSIRYSVGLPVDSFI